jgi:hypothetical protein
MQSARAAGDSQGPPPLRDLGWLIGGSWQTIGQGVPLTVKTTYSWSPNGAIIEFTTAFMSNGQSKNKYDGHFYVDPGTQNVIVWYAHDDFTITQAPVEVRRQLGFSMQFKEADDSKTLQTYRVIVTRTGADAYTWELDEQSGSVWQKALTLHFVRS